MTDTGDGKTVESPDQSLTGPQAMIAALRARGAHRFEPVRFHFIEALAKRASVQTGDSRRILDGRLSLALSKHTSAFEGAQAELVSVAAGAEQLGAVCLDRDGKLRSLTAQLQGRQQRPIADLVQHLAQQSGTLLRQPGEAGAAGEAVTDANSPAELKTVRYFRSTWARLSVDQRLTRSLQAVPQNAGPLNSHVLALRSLQGMHELSPAYLGRFMSYLDALLWLDQVNTGRAPVQKESVRNESEMKRKSVRKKPG